MNRWYVPSWCGDFRLEKKDDNACLLIVTDPIPDEIEQLGQFLRKARKKGWVKEIEGVKPEGESILKVGASVTDAAKVLLGRGGAPYRDQIRKGILTAIKSVDGEVTAVEGDGPELDKAAKKEDAKEAATVRRPTLCCPACISGPDKRASEVLQSFSTTKQWNDWLSMGMLYCYGNLTGRPYQVSHRHHPISRQNKFITWDVEGGHVMHAWDWSVPPAEEVLMIKLVLEHAEHWIRNQSGHFGTSGEKFVNPFMEEAGMSQLSDGLISTGILTGFGKGLKQLLGIS
jgi:hypothetical protein